MSSGEYCEVAGDVTPATYTEDQAETISAYGSHPWNCTALAYPEALVYT